MKLLKDWKSLLASCLLSALIVGAALYLATGSRLLSFGNDLVDVAAPSPIKEIQDNRNNDSKVNKIATSNPEPAIATPPKSSEKHKPTIGLFRGDWGPTPIYAKHDAVNFERGVYLSLVDNNQNQPPATSQGYWRLIKKRKNLHEENCFNPAPGMDLDECDFSIQDNALKDRDLRNARLIKARLSGELGAADLSGANLSGAAVLGTLVINSDTRMTGTDLSYLQSDGNNPVIAENADLTGVNFTKANLYGAKLSHADLTRAKLPEAVLTGANLTSANLSEAGLEKADLSYATLSQGQLNKAMLKGVNLEQADISYADFSGASLQQANLAGTQLTGVNLSGADLHGATFISAQGADSALIDSQTNFTAAVCPDGATVDGTQVTTCVGHGF